jgi:hypothetical protein
MCVEKLLLGHPLSEGIVAPHELFDASHAGVVAIADAALQNQLVLFFVELVVVLLFVRVVSVAKEICVAAILILRVDLVFRIVGRVIVLSCWQSGHKKLFVLDTQLMQICGRVILTVLVLIILPKLVVLILC